MSSVVTSLSPSSAWISGSAFSGISCGRGQTAAFGARHFISTCSTQWSTPSVPTRLGLAAAAFALALAFAAAAFALAFACASPAFASAFGVPPAGSQVGQLLQVGVDKLLLTVKVPEGWVSGQPLLLRPPAHDGPAHSKNSMFGRVFEIPHH